MTERRGGSTHLPGTQQSSMVIHFPNKIQIHSMSGANIQSAMLEKERKELEKIKFRQKKDIE